MISRKYQKVVVSFFMALFMSCIMSFVITVFNVGLVSNLMTIWLKAWSFAFAVALPTVSLISPVVLKLVNFVLHDEEDSA